MPGWQLIAWRTKLERELRKIDPETRVTMHEASTFLGVSPQGYRNMETNGAPLSIAYACAAIMEGVDPFGKKDLGEPEFENDRLHAPTMAAFAKYERRKRR